jgi:hypothetical protein
MKYCTTFLLLFLVTGCASLESVDRQVLERINNKLSADEDDQDKINERIEKIHQRLDLLERQFAIEKDRLKQLRKACLQIESPFVNNMKQFRLQTNQRLNLLETKVTTETLDKANKNEWPLTITSRADIVRIAEIVIGEDLIRKPVEDRSKLRAIARKIRDAITSMYDEWELSDVRNPEIRLDIISEKGSGRNTGNWDFFLGWNKGSLIPLDHLQWHKHK